MKRYVTTLSVNNFNSIKVRLEQTFYISDKLTLSLFQFHKGAIRTDVSARNLFTAKIFQFHKGAIRTQYSSIEYDFCFISIP